MIIACATDSNYAELAGALLRSIAVNGDVPDAEIVICGDGLSERDKQWLAQSASDLNVRFVDVRGEHLARIHRFKSPRGTSTFTRLLVPDLLPETREPILYLDADIVVNRSLKPLLATDMTDRALAAVPAALHEDQIAFHNRTIGRHPSRTYVNAGVLIINPVEWRERDLADRCLEVLSWSKAIKLADQDAINAILGDEALLLDRTWNFYSNFAPNLIAADFEAAHIVHFTGLKPNYVECVHPARHLFLDHRAYTPWREDPLRSKQAGIAGAVRKLFS